MRTSVLATLSSGIVPPSSVGPFAAWRHSAIVSRWSPQPSRLRRLTAARALRARRVLFRPA